MTNGFLFHEKGHFIDACQILSVVTVILRKIMTDKYDIY